MRLKSGAILFWAVLMGLLLVVYFVYRVKFADDTIMATLHEKWGPEVRITDKQIRHDSPQADFIIVKFDVWHGGRWEQHACLFTVSKNDGECRFAFDLPFVQQKK